MKTPNDVPPDSTGEFPDRLVWVSHPAKIKKKASIAVILFIVLVMAIVYYVTYSPFMVFLALLLFTGSLSTFFFPTRYEIDRNEVIVKYLFSSVKKNMNTFRSFYPDKNGVLLSPFPKPSRLENFRGLYIRYHENKAEVDAYITKLFAERKNGN